MSEYEIVHCTICQETDQEPNVTFHRHPWLPVAICGACHDRMKDIGSLSEQSSVPDKLSAVISKDADGLDEECSWCGEGGELVMCDKCSRGFCKECLQVFFVALFSC